MEDAEGEDEVSTETAPSERKKVNEGDETTLTGGTAGLIYPELGIEVGRSLVSGPQTHGDVETGYAEHDLPPAGNGEMS